ncbi:MAG: hypothetical protein MZW92_34960 [Comamonadaceae bacterium]|nr:hypothetical protein [Comamonadaceae bacterium]
MRQLGCRRVLNCYCYTGGFTRGGAGRRRRPRDQRRLVGAGAASACAAHVALNGFDAARQRGARRRRQPVPARALKAGRALRRHRARPAEVRAHRRRMPSAPRAPTRTSTAWR